MSIRLRVATQSDVPRIVALSQEWADEGCTRGVIADSADDLTQQLCPFFLVAEHRTEGVVGYVRGSVGDEHISVIPEGSSYLSIHDLFVTKAHRRSGVGTALMQRLMAVARDEGIKHFRTYTANIAMSETVEFYARFGFEVWSASMFHTPEASDQS